MFCSWRDRRFVPDRRVVRKLGKAKLDTAELVVPDHVDVDLHLDVICRSARRDAGRQRVRYGVLGGTDCVQYIMDADILWTTAAERRVVCDGGLVAVGAGVRDHALAV